MHTHPDNIIIENRKGKWEMEKQNVWILIIIENRKGKWEMEKQNVWILIINQYGVGGINPRELRGYF
jgi:hypothetical protein